MFSLVLSFIIFSLISNSSSSESEPFSIHQCCLKGQKLSIDETGTHGCQEVGIPDEGGPSNDTADGFDLFPIDLIVNATTLKNYESDIDRYWEILRGNYEIREGFFPNCSIDEQGFGVAANHTSDFYLLLHDNLTLRFYISKKNSHIFDDELGKMVEMEAGIKSNGELQTFSLSDACFDFTPNRTTIVYCPCLHNACIRKCCPHGQFLKMSAGNNTCEEAAGTPIYGRKPKTEQIIDQPYFLLNTRPHCNISALKEMNTCRAKTYPEHKDFQFLSNGSIEITKYQRLVSPEEYCVDATMYPDGTIYDENLFLCTKNEQKEDPLKETIVIYGVLLILSGVVYVLTVWISGYLPELKKTIHHKIAFRFNLSLMVACFAGGIAKLDNVKGRNCIFFASLTQFSFLASVFWLNVMCIDITSTFSTPKSGGGSMVAKERRNFIFYSVHAWGSAAIITIVTIGMEISSQALPSDFRPGFTCNCGFDIENSAIFLHYYGPMALILVVSLILLVYTTFKIQREIVLHINEPCRTEEDPHQLDKQRLVLYAKLFLLMGLSWLTEILSWVIGGMEDHLYFTGGINLFRAVFIFILFICKRPILASLARKVRNSPSLRFSNSTKSKNVRASTDMIQMRRLSNSSPRASQRLQDNLTRDSLTQPL